MVQVKINFLSDYSPLDRPGIWGDFTVTTEMVNKCLENKDFINFPINGTSLNKTPLNHAKRIAYLTKNGWKDAIIICVGVPQIVDTLPYVEDGNHRLAAAIMRSDQYINVVIDGSLDHAQNLFGVRF